MPIVCDALHDVQILVRGSYNAIAALIDQGIEIFLGSLEIVRGGVSFVLKIPDMRVIELVTAIAPGAHIEIVGIDPGEKLYQEIISIDDAHRTVDIGDRYVIQPEFASWGEDRVDGVPVPEGFASKSDRNDDWLSDDALRDMLSHT